MSSSAQVMGHHVVDAFKADIEGFFDGEAGFELRFETSGVLPTCKGVGEKARIVLPNDLLMSQVNTFADLVFLLFVLGHETAHYMHRHNEHVDESSLESRAVEMWADYFGTKVALVVVTIGDKISDLASALPDGKCSGDRIDAFASALARLADSYFNVRHPRYEPVGVRIATCIAGLLSFFQVLFPLQAGAKDGVRGYLHASNPVVVVQRAFALQMRIYRDGTLICLMGNSVAPELSSEQVRTIAAVHRGLQAERPAMFSGMRTAPALWLSLDYGIPEEERRVLASRRMEVLKETLKQIGIDLPPDGHLHHI